MMIYTTVNELDEAGYCIWLGILALLRTDVYLVWSQYRFFFSSVRLQSYQRTSRFLETQQQSLIMASTELVNIKFSDREVIRSINKMKELTNCNTFDYSSSSAPQCPFFFLALAGRMCHKCFIVLVLVHAFFAVPV